MPPVKNSVLHSGRGDLFVPFTYTMPLGEKDFEGQIGFEILENDSYGRTLCRLSFLSCPNDFFGRYGAAYGVIQSSTKFTTSFYEDFCCAGTVDQADSEEIMRQLKEINDWEQPLNPEKMTILPYKGLEPAGCYKISDFYDYDIYQKTAWEALGLASYGSYFDYICRDRYGRTLISISYPEENLVYLVMMKDKEVLQGDASSCLIEDMYSPWEEIHAFKQANSWNQP